ncbi:MAG: hypothetical protein LBD20_05770 [Spirochaetaceae bacterium]|jgi:hypothetical protein|nr:hypothetical protein [Spirochaetaceae bacterium]
MVNDSRLILIGSGGRNSGKTHLAVKLISQYAKQGVYALKVTGVEALGLCCARGGEGCGACRLEQDYVLIREADASAAKDTSLMLAAGAREVWWLRSLRDVMEKAYRDFSARIPAGALVIAESNSLRHFVQPALFIMLTDPAAPCKKSAAEVAAYADFDVTPPLDDKTLAAIVKKVPLVNV